MATELSFDETLRVLDQHDVAFILVGGVAAILQGSPLTTEDIDIVYLSSDENLARLNKALADLEAYYFDPAGRRLRPNIDRLATMNVHLLKTRCGRVDLLRIVGNNLAYQDLIHRTQLLDVDKTRVRTLALEAIIETKEYADRPKDRYQLLFLRQLLTEKRRLEDL